MNNLVKMVVVFVVLCLAAPFSYAQHDDLSEGQEVSGKSAERKEKYRKKMEAFFSQLNLTEEQKAQLKENKEKNRAQRKAGFEKMKSSKEALKQELMKPELDMGKIQEIQGQLKDAQAQMADERLNSILEIRKILTPEQFAQFMALKDQHRRKFNKEEPPASSAQE